MNHEAMTTKQLQQAKKCSYGSGCFAVTDSGVYFLGKDKEGNDLLPLWICSHLKVVAETRDEHSKAWGRLLEWMDNDNVQHQRALPLETLEGDGSEVRRLLADEGLCIASTRAARDLLCIYIKVWKVAARARCVDRLGWHDSAYVCASRVFGESDERYVYQHPHATASALTVAGSLDQWRHEVAAKAIGNSRLIFALSTSFAGPLLRLVGADGGGFHLRGQSSSGKSTALLVAASVWGNPKDNVRLWRTTTNGLEGLASQHNDGLLVLDELSQIKPEDAGEAAYLLANGRGKTRATRSGSTKPAAQWRLLFLSAGEESLLSLMNQGGKRSTAGQEIRMADVAADAGAGMGMFESLHEFGNAAALAQALKRASAAFYGQAGVAWLELLVRDLDALPGWLKERIQRFAKYVVPPGAGGQVERVAQRFGLVAAAGERASLGGLTGWPEGAADSAANACFAAWLEGFGGAGNREERAICAQTQAFLVAHGASRFEEMHAGNEQRIINRAGFWRHGTNGDREYLMPSVSFKMELVVGHDEKLVKNALIAAGLLIRGKDGKSMQCVRLPGLGPQKVYVLRAAPQAALAERR